ncbi:MAG TPA: biotin/lipoyl-containing protein, partial [Pseudoxanthomonas sp.]|nr:biotin/lipoyl-containing protein [Pseudoxanthomonas sp.]
AVVEASIDTGYLDRHLDEFMPSEAQDAALLCAAAAVALLEEQEAAALDAAAVSADPHSPWAIADGWRLGHAGIRRLAFLHRDREIVLDVHGNRGDYRIETSDDQWRIEGARLTAAGLSLRINREARRFGVIRRGSRLTVHDGLQRLQLDIVAAYRPGDASESTGDGRIVAPMPGRVVLIKAKAGDAVISGQELLVMEAMKMELALKAPRDGIVSELRAVAGDFVEADAVLAVLE